jgi:hypothetical protein
MASTTRKIREKRKNASGDYDIIHRETEGGLVKLNDSTTAQDHVSDSTIHITAVERTQWDSAVTTAAGAASSIASHAGNTNNPHSVTAAQIGSMTEEQIRELVASGSFLTYAGVISASDPTGTMTPNPNTPNYWYQSSAMTFPTSFPLAVKSWSFTTSAWVDASYEPEVGDLWSNLNITGGAPNGVYWFNGEWNQLDFHVDLSPYRTAAAQDTIDSELSSAVTAASTQAMATTACSTAAATVAKTTGTIAGWTREVGSRVAVTITNGNTANAPTLNVSGTGSAAIHCDGVAPPADMLPPGIVAMLIWDGTYWQLLNPAPAYASTALTLGSTGWVGEEAPYSYTITTTAIRITATSLQTIMPNTTDISILTAASDANILADNSQQATDTIVLIAYGDKPAVDIPVLLVSQSDRG